MTNPLVSVCEVPDCATAAYRRRLCGTHYHRWQRHGDPLAVAIPRRYSGTENAAWRGENASYTQKHRRVYASRGKADRCIIFLCSTGSKCFDWANVSGNYDDPADYMPMCRAHHWQYDNARRAQ